MTRVALILLIAAGCTGSIGDPEAEPPTYEPMNPTAPTPVDPNVTQCVGDRIHLLRRLTPPQYLSQIQRMFPNVEFDELEPPGVVPLKFDYKNDASLSGPTPDVVARYQTTAFEVAAKAVEEKDVWVTCDLAEESCQRDTVLKSAERGLRRPLNQSEEALFDMALNNTFTPEQRLEVALAGILQTPEFIYVSEIGSEDAPAPEGLKALLPHELASRLALFLWDEPADEELIAKLSEASAATDEGYAAIVDSMFDDPRINKGVDRFTTQWMPLRDGEWGSSIGLYELRDNNDAWPDSEFPGDGRFGRESILESATLFLRQAFLGGDLSEMFTGREVMLNDYLAKLYGLPLDVDEVELSMRTIPENQPGILTHPAVLTSPPSNATFRSIYRAVLIMNRITCQETGQPNFAQIETSRALQDRVISSREALETAHLADGCGGSCHKAIDGIGFPFMAYDRLGRYQAEETLTQRILVSDPAYTNNCRGQDERRTCEVTEAIPIDTSGEILGEQVSDAVAFSNAIADSPEVERCFAEHLYRYGLGRSSLSITDRDEIDVIAEKMRSAGAIRGAAVAITMTESFRYMAECEVGQ